MLSDLNLQCLLRSKGVSDKTEIWLRGLAKIIFRIFFQCKPCTHWNCFTEIIPVNTHEICFQIEIRKNHVQKCLNIFPAFYFQDNLKRKAEHLAQSDNNDNPERKRRKTGISAKEQLNTLVAEWFKMMPTQEDQCFGSTYSTESFKVCGRLGTK